MFTINTLNNISTLGLDNFPKEHYQISDAAEAPDAIILRSFKMHEMPIPASLKAVGRAGAGVNNIPLNRMTDAGIPVFNAPGANANAVKELVLASLFLSARNLIEAVQYTNELDGDDAELSKLVEAGKKKFAGYELPGKTIGVIGLGAIGRMVANSCADLGMRVIGFDPGLTVEGAWQLSADVLRAESVNELLPQVDFLTVHVPLIDATRDLINQDNVKQLASTAVVINLARGGIVNDAAVCDALDQGRLGAYITDFPNNRTRQSSGVIGLPHLGASTGEAEDNCAIMVVEQVRDFLEHGNIRNSVNFPAVKMARGSDYRIAISNANVPNMVGQISTIMANANLNIHDMINQSRGDIAHTIVDVDSAISDQVVLEIRALEGVKMARRL